MDALFAFLTNMLTTAPWLVVPLLLVAGIYGYPALRKWQKENSTVADESEQIRKAGEAIRAELNGMLDKEQLRVEALAVSLDSARIEVGKLHGENIALHSDMVRLRGEMKTLYRTARAMRLAMKRAISDNDVRPLVIWLDLNPDDESELTAPPVPLVPPDAPR